MEENGEQMNEDSGADAAAKKNSGDVEVAARRTKIGDKDDSWVRFLFTELLAHPVDYFQSKNSGKTTIRVNVAYSLKQKYDINKSADDIQSAISAYLFQKKCPACLTSKEDMTNWSLLMKKANSPHWVRFLFEELLTHPTDYFLAQDKTEILKNIADSLFEKLKIKLEVKTISSAIGLYLYQKQWPASLDIKKDEDTWQILTERAAAGAAAARKSTYWHCLVLKELSMQPKYFHMSKAAAAEELSKVLQISYKVNRAASSVLRAMQCLSVHAVNGNIPESFTRKERGQFERIKDLLTSRFRSTRLVVVRKSRSPVIQQVVVARSQKGQPKTRNIFRDFFNGATKYEARKELRQPMTGLRSPAARKKSRRTVQKVIQKVAGGHVQKKQQNARRGNAFLHLSNNDGVDLAMDTAKKEIKYTVTGSDRPPALMMTPLTQKAVGGQDGKNLQEKSKEMKNATSEFCDKGDGVNMDDTMESDIEDCEVPFIGYTDDVIANNPMATEKKMETEIDEIRKRMREEVMQEINDIVEAKDEELRKAREEVKMAMNSAEQKINVVVEAKKEELRKAKEEWRREMSEAMENAKNQINVVTKIKEEELRKAREEVKAATDSADQKINDVVEAKNEELRKAKKELRKAKEELRKAREEVKMATDSAAQMINDVVEAKNEELRKAKEEIAALHDEIEEMKLPKQHRHLAKLKRKTIGEGEFALTDIVGTGTFGIVFRAQEKQTGKVCAIKVVQDEEVISAELDVMRELGDVSSSCRFLVVPSLFFSGEHDGITFTAFRMELLHADLHKMVLHSTSINKWFPPASVVSIMGQIFAALAFLNKKGFIHSDIKLENVLVKAFKVEKIGPEQEHILFPEVLLTDLNTIFSISEGIDFCQTVAYRSPEIILGYSATVKIDSWSMGIMALVILAKAIVLDIDYDDDEKILEHLIRIEGLTGFQILDGMLKNKNLTQKDLPKRVPDGQLNMENILNALEPSDATSVLKDYIEKLLEFHPNERPSPSEAAEFLKEFILLP